MTSTVKGGGRAARGGCEKGGEGEGGTRSDGRALGAT